MKLKSGIKLMSLAAIIAGLFIFNADAAGAADIKWGTLCGEMANIFKLLRNLAFIGAAFIIANWAWGFISTGKVDFTGDDGLRGKFLALLVGFALLSGVGILLSVLPGAVCTGTNW
ncbi:MAG: hypothetical protein LBB23_04140 [Rickettsiales bacterium]|jgi:hypothetical protein|nr:hypothetical protein [Rickettsiales bacterium]